MKIYLIRHSESIDDVATTILEYNNGEFKIIETRGIKFGENIKR